MSIQRTHWDDCWKYGPEHYECAVGEIERLREWANFSAAPYKAEVDGLRSDLEKERERYEAEVKRLRADAERYRWLCDNRLHSVSHPNGDAWGMSEVIYGDDLDAAIDKARGES